MFSDKLYFIPAKNDFFYFNVISIRLFGLYYKLIIWMTILLQFRYFNGINNKFIYIALHFAVENNSIEITKLLLENSKINTSMKNKILSL